MAIGKDKTQFPLILPKNLKATLEEKAQKENRSLSNYIVYLLQKAMDEQEG